MELSVIKTHASRLIREPLVWVGFAVLCVPMLGSGTLKKLRNSLMMDSTRVEAVQLASASTDASDTPSADSGREIREALLAAESAKSNDSPSMRTQDAFLDDAETEENMQVSLPLNVQPALAAADPDPARDPGSLFDAAEELGMDDIDDQENAGAATRSQASAQNSKDDDEFDFLFGDEAEEPAPKQSRSRDAEVADGTKPYSGDKRRSVPVPNEDSREWLFPPDSDAETRDPGSFEPPSANRRNSIAGSGPFNPSAAIPESIEAESFQPGIWTRNPGASIMNATQYPPLDPRATMMGSSASPVVMGGTSIYSSADNTCNSAACSTPTYQSVVTSEVPVANYVFGVTGLFFQRDYEDNRRLAANPAGEELFTNDADEHSFDGYGLMLGRRNACGNGIELAYWALNPGVASAEISGSNVVTAIAGLEQLLHSPSGENLYDIYSYSQTQRIARDTDINNLELNFLRNGGSYCSLRNRQATYEFVGGLRWFDFDEELLYSSFTDTATYPTVPSEFNYHVRARNTLIGLQGGVRNELHFGAKLRFFNHVYGGIFNNNINTAQSITDANGVIPLVGGAMGNQFRYDNSKNDVAFLGQLDFGLLLQLTCNSRIRFGYRVLGVSGVALAAEQLPYQYDSDGFSRVQSNGNLLLNGGYYGLEFAF